VLYSAVNIYNESMKEKCVPGSGILYRRLENKQDET
jgi:hypothetical protein